MSRPSQQLSPRYACGPGKGPTPTARMHTTHKPLHKHLALWPRQGPHHVRSYNTVCEDQEKWTLWYSLIMHTVLIPNHLPCLMHLVQLLSLLEFTKIEQVEVKANRKKSGQSIALYRARQADHLSLKKTKNWMGTKWYVWMWWVSVTLWDKEKPKLPTSQAD